MKRINKAQARKLFNVGEKIYLYPCKANIHSQWFAGNHGVSKAEYEKINFDDLVSMFEFCNCHSGLGDYAAFYINE